jgi:hypothetical protein
LALTLARFLHDFIWGPWQKERFGMNNSFKGFLSLSFMGLILTTCGGGGGGGGSSSTDTTPTVALNFEVPTTTTSASALRAGMKSAGLSMSVPLELADIQGKVQAYLYVTDGTEGVRQSIEISNLNIANDTISFGIPDVNVDLDGDGTAETSVNVGSDSGAMIEVVVDLTGNPNVGEELGIITPISDIIDSSDGKAKCPITPEISGLRKIIQETIANYGEEFPTPHFMNLTDMASKWLATGEAVPTGNRLAAMVAQFREENLVWKESFLEDESLGRNAFRGSSAAFGKMVKEMVVSSIDLDTVLDRMGGKMYEEWDALGIPLEKYSGIQNAVKAAGEAKIAALKSQYSSDADFLTAFEIAHLAMGEAMEMGLTLFELGGFNAFVDDPDYAEMMTSLQGAVDAKDMKLADAKMFLDPSGYIRATFGNQAVEKCSGCTGFDFETQIGNLSCDEALAKDLDVLAEETGATSAGVPPSVFRERLEYSCRFEELECGTVDLSNPGSVSDCSKLRDPDEVANMAGQFGGMVSVAYFGELIKVAQEDLGYKSVEEFFGLDAGALGGQDLSQYTDFDQFKEEAGIDSTFDFANQFAGETTANTTSGTTTGSTSTTTGTTTGSGTTATTTTSTTTTTGGTTPTTTVASASLAFHISDASGTALAAGTSVPVGGTLYVCVTSGSIAAGTAMKFTPKSGGTDSNQITTLNASTSSPPSACSSGLLTGPLTAGIVSIVDAEYYLKIGSTNSSNYIRIVASLGGTLAITAQDPSSSANYPVGTNIQKGTGTPPTGGTAPRLVATTGSFGTDFSMVVVQVSPYSTADCSGSAGSVPAGGEAVPMDQPQFTSTRIQVISIPSTVSYTGPFRFKVIVGGTTTGTSQCLNLQ